MRIKLALAALAVAGCATSAAAQDARVDYVQFNLGSGIVGTVDVSAFDNEDDATGDIDIEAGLFGSIAAGTKAGSYPVRIEGEFLLTDNDIESDDLEPFVEDISVSSYAFMLNALYDFQVDRFTPYVGAGIGYGRISYDVDGSQANDKGFAWQVRAGITMPVSDRSTVDFGYRYLSMPEFDRSDSGITLEADADAHILSIGARFGF